MAATRASNRPVHSDCFVTGKAGQKACHAFASIGQATGKAAYTGDVSEEGVDVGNDADAVEAEMVIAP